MLVINGALSTSFMKKLNNAEFEKRLIILNDNKMSIDKPVGAIILKHIKSYSNIRNLIKI